MNTTPDHYLIVRAFHALLAIAIVGAVLSVGILHTAAETIAADARYRPLVQQAEADLCPGGKVVWRAEGAGVPMGVLQ